PHAERRYEDDHQSHEPDDVGIAELRLGSEDGNEKRRDRSDHADGRRDAEDPTALVIGGREGRAPGGLRQTDAGMAEITGEETDEEIEPADAFGREEELIAGEGENRHTGSQPYAISPERRVRAIHGVAQQRIHKDIENPDRRPGGADHGERYAK